MNEKIKLLALQAGFAYEPTKDQLWVDGPTEIMISPGLEKFAELIVRECADVCRREWVVSSSAQRYGDQCADSIEHYFNIKETV